MRAIFENVRVLSLAEQYPGPYATLLLADLGADVILVERPGQGDPARAYPPFFNSLARNKRSICLDLKNVSDKDKLVALAAQADVIIEGYRPGTMDRLGVGYEALKAVNEKLIYASVSGFGQTGPNKRRTAHDLSYLSFSGHLFGQATGTQSDFPVVSYADLNAAMFAAFSIASALYARERSGQGTAIDVSMTDGLVSWMTTYLAPAMDNQRPFEILGEPAYGFFDVKGGRRITLSIAHEDHFWRALCNLLGMADVADLRQPERLRDSAKLKERIASALVLQDLDYWHLLLDQNDIPWSPVNDLHNVLSDPHILERDMFRKLEHTDGTIEKHVIQPVCFSAWESSIRSPSPKLGEHTAEVLEEFGIAQD